MAFNTNKSSDSSTLPLDWYLDLGIFNTTTIKYCVIFLSITNAILSSSVDFGMINYIDDDGEVLLILYGGPQEYKDFHISLTFYHADALMTIY